MWHFYLLAEIQISGGELKMIHEDLFPANYGIPHHILHVFSTFVHLFPVVYWDQKDSFVMGLGILITTTLVLSIPTHVQTR